MRARLTYHGIGRNRRPQSTGGTMGYYHLHEATNTLERCTPEVRCAMPSAPHYSRSGSERSARTGVLLSHRKPVAPATPSLRSPVSAPKAFPGEPTTRGALRLGDRVLDPGSGALWTVVENSEGELELANSASKDFRLPTTGMWAALRAYRQ